LGQELLNYPSGAPVFTPSF